MKLVVSIGDLISLVVGGVAITFLLLVFIYSKVKQIIKKFKN